MKYLATALALAALLTLIYNPYSSSTPRECTVIEKMEIAPPGKHFRVNQVLILKENETGLLFDLEVSPVTYYKAKQGKQMTFTLSEEDLRPHGGKFIAFVLIPLLVLLCSVAYIVLLIMLFIFEL